MSGVDADRASSTKIVGIRRLSDDVLQVRCSVPSGFSWSPGQHVAVLASPTGTPSYYSIASADLVPPGAGRVLELAMRESSIKWPLPLQVGQQLYLSTPSGGPPTVSVQGAPHLILIGMGTGVAPLRALAQARLASAVGSSCLTVIQGARRLEECLFFDEFSAIGQPGLDYRPVLSQPGAGWAGRHGYVQDHLTDLPPRDVYFCICGKLAMVEDVTARLTKLGVHADAIFSEGY